MVRRNATVFPCVTVTVTKGKLRKLYNTTSLWNSSNCSFQWLSSHRQKSHQFSSLLLHFCLGQLISLAPWECDHNYQSLSHEVIFIDKPKNAKMRISLRQIIKVIFALPSPSKKLTFLSCIFWRYFHDQHHLDECHSMSLVCTQIHQILKLFF